MRPWRTSRRLRGSWLAERVDGESASSSSRIRRVCTGVCTRAVDNAKRSLWVTETALATALNTSYMAEQLSIFGIVVGVALLLSGMGLGILAVGGALRNPETALSFLRRKKARGGPKAAKA